MTTSSHSWLQKPRSGLTRGRCRREQRRRGSFRSVMPWPNLEVLEGRCLPSFTPITSYSVGATPDVVAAADFDNDGQLDLATPNFHDDTVSVLLGNTDGTFQPARSSAAGPY